MKQFLFALAALSLLFACTQEENNPSGTDEPEGGKDKTVHVTGIELDRTSATIKEGESITLVATVSPDNADNKAVSWSSSSNDVATVDASGKVTGIKAGSATITATTKDGDKTASCAITVEQNSAPTVHVTGIEFDRTSATIKEGESITLVATISPDNADNKSVSWSSSSDAVATVDASGKVTGVKAGSATITATTEDGGKKATCSISVEANLAPSVTIDAKNVSAISAVLAGKANLGSTVASDLKVGFQYSKSAGILPQNSVSVDAEDVDSDYNYTTPITGLEPATKYYFRSFVRQNGQDTYGETKEFATKDVASLLETWDASEVEAAKATLNAKLDLTDVLYTNLAYGFLLGTSESALNTDYKCTKIKDNAISTPLTDLSHKTQYWYKAYVKLDSQTFYGEVKSFTTDVVPVENVSLDKTEYTFNTIGNTLTLVATVLPADATEKGIIWASDNEDVATVDTNGKVIALGNGMATITVTTSDQGMTATCVITVAQWVTSISLDKSSLTLNEGQEQTLIPTVNPSNAADKTLNLTSSDTSVATVDAEGKVTAISKGTATIKAEAKDGSGKYASCSVTVNRLVTSIQLNRTSRWMMIGDNFKLYVTSILPDDASNKDYILSSSDSAVASVDGSGVVTARTEGHADIKATACDGSGIFASCTVIVDDEKVDMGIKTSDGKTLYWSTRNLCESGLVNRPEDYGDYYAWGETEPKSDYSWSTYKWCNGSNRTLTKYNNDSSYGAVDNKTVLDPEDDVAHVKLGGKWRMPTDAEWNELRTKCTWDAVKVKGVKGHRVIATNGNTIFLPAAGYYYSYGFSQGGVSGYLWSSSLYTDSPSTAWEFHWDSSVFYKSHSARYFGCSVRPVTE